MTILKTVVILSTLAASIFLISSCQKTVYRSNGESIYRSGRNLQGEMMLDKSRSAVKIFKSCQSCHGPSGDRMKYTPISYRELSNPIFYPIPYDDSTIVRFIDYDLKSNGQKADIGVRWHMSDEDKKDLIEYLKTLSKSVN